MAEDTKVCVTGGASYLGSWLVMRLLQRRYTVHATSRNLGQVNVQVLKHLPGADSQLRLFQAEISDKEAIQQAIRGCSYVIHMATPLHDLPSGDMAEAAVAGAKNVAEACIKSGTVKRLIFTGTVISASPLKDSGHSLYHDSINETCWTPLDTDLPLADSYLMGYARSKTVSEKELLKYNDSSETLEVVSLATGLVGGDTILGYVTDSTKTLLSQISGDEVYYRGLRFIEEVAGKVPIAHVEDICNAHIFCMENPSIKGRFLCANGYLKTAEIAEYIVKQFPSINIPQRLIEDTQRSITWGSTKLQDAGFEYRYDAAETLNQSVKLAIRLGEVTL